MSDHECRKIDKIEAMEREVEHLKHRVNGYEDEAGIFADMKHILKNQQEEKEDKKNDMLWIRGSVFTFTGFIITLFIIGITDHNKIQDFPDIYLSKSVVNQVVMELKQQTAIMTKIVNSPSLDSLLTYREELRELQQNSSFDKMMRATRGGDTNKTKFKLPGGIDPDKLYNELMKQKEAGTDTGTYEERKKRIDPKLLK